jgi:hypothetical protein
MQVFANRRIRAAMLQSGSPCTNKNSRAEAALASTRQACAKNSVISNLTRLHHLIELNRFAVGSISAERDFAVEFEFRTEGHVV